MVVLISVLALLALLGLAWFGLALFGPRRRRGEDLIWFPDEDGEI